MSVGVVAWVRARFKICWHRMTGHISGTDLPAPKTLREAFDFHGVSFPPGHKDLECEGTLTFDPDYGARLEVQGGEELLQHVKLTKTLWGTSEEGAEVTLFDFPVWQRQHSLFNKPPRRLRKDVKIDLGAGLSFATYHFGEVFLGAHIKNPEDIRLKNLAISFSS